MADKIIIFSGKQYSGKDTAAKILMEFLPQYKRFAMGDVIKIEYSKIHGISFDEIESNKSKYRQGLIDLGNWGREQNKDYWLTKILAQKGSIVVTDVRLKHEYELFKSAGAISIRIETDRDIREQRGGKLVAENDITEIDLDYVTDWDFVIENNSDYETLKQNMLFIIQKISE